MRTVLSLASLLTGVLLAAAGCSSDDGGNVQGGPDAGPGTDGRPGTDGGTEPPIDAGIDAPPPPQPQMLTVCATGDADFPTISAAITAANAGSTLRVCPGTYRERLRISKPLTLIATGGAPETVIDADELDTAVTVSGAGHVTLERFTIKRGRTQAEGGGIRCNDSKLTVVGSNLDANHAGTGGGGLYASACELDLRGNAFTANRSDLFGGGALLVNATGTIADGRFATNDAFNVGGAIATQGGDLAIVNNLIRDNIGHRGGGIHAEGQLRIHGNQIIANTGRWTGGGMHLIGFAPVITNNVIAENTSVNDGGGVYLANSNATVMNNEVRANRSGDDGGGIRVFECMATLTANLVEDNYSADGGGGVRISHVPSMLIDNIIRNNQAGGTGGGLDLDNDSSLVRGGEIRGNRAGGSGGGVLAWLGWGGGHRFEDVVIADNRAWQGGGLYIVDNFSPVTMRGLTITGNRAGHGGAIFVRATDFTISRSLVADNRGTQRGGGVLAGSNEPWEGLDPSMPGACPCPPVDPVGQVLFSVIARNESPAGAGIWTSLPGLQVGNSILYNNLGTAIQAAPDEFIEPPMVPGDGPPMEPPNEVPDVAYSDIFPASFAGMMDPTGSQGNLSVDPSFVDAANNDFHLAPGSACIDAGAPFLFDGDGSRADMGMFGGTP